MEYATQETTILDLMAEGEAHDPAAGSDPAGTDQAGGGDSSATNDPGAGDGTTEGQPADQAAADPSEAMWGDLTADEAAAAGDPHAAQPHALPESVQKALGLSEYVREPEHIEAAVKTAAEVWDVVAGKSPASALLEGLRGQNPQQYEKVIREDIIPYIEHITGQKFGSGEATPPDPLKAMQAELAELKNRPQIEAQQRQQQQEIRNAYAATEQTLTPLIEKGNGVFEGDMQGAMTAIAAQLPKLGISNAQLQKEVLSGNMANLEKAYKAAEKAKTLEVKAYADRIKGRYTKLKGAVPAAKGAPAAAAASGTDAPDMTTQAGRAKWMADQFNQGAGA